MSEQSFIVSVKVTSWFKKYTNGQLEQNVEISRGTTIADLIRSMGIPISDIGSYIIMNSSSTYFDESNIEVKRKRSVDASYELVYGDTLQIIPLLIGG